MPALAETQQLLWQLITAPDGVAAAIGADGQRGDGALAAALTRTVRGDGPLDATQRLDIYANMYFFRILEVVRDDYPALAALLGSTGFHNLITDYLLACPPVHFSIRHVGDRLAAFVATHSVRAARPYLEDLARFEGALNDAFDASDAAVRTAADLAAVPATAWGGLQLLWHPSVRLLNCAWPVHEIRTAVDRGEMPGPPQPAVTRLCVWRQGLEVRHRAVESLEFEAMIRVRDGAPFGDVCAAADAHGEDTARQLAAAIAGWVRDECITAFDLGG